MAGAGTPTPSKGGKKAVDFTVNLVPTIDLLSVLISFLLITAVWTHLARINTDQAIPQASDRPMDNPEIEKKLNILISPDEIAFNLTGEEARRIKKQPEDAHLREFMEALKEVKKRASEKQKVIIASEDTVPYHSLIEVMDICLDLGLSGISVGDLNAVKSELL